MGSATLGIIAGFNIGQSALLWHVRGLAAVRRVFARVWQCKESELLTSFDGCGVFRPWQCDKLWKTMGSWYHVDQNPNNKPGLHCVQGLVSLYDQDKTTGGLVVIPGTHRRQNELLPCTARLDFLSIPRSHHLLRASKEAVLVSCRAGDLVLWDSRTVHCNSPALTDQHKDCSKGDGMFEMLRAVTYGTYGATLFLYGLWCLLCSRSDHCVARCPVQCV